MRGEADRRGSSERREQPEDPGAGEVGEDEVCAVLEEPGDLLGTAGEDDHLPGRLDGRRDAALVEQVRGEDHDGRHVSILSALSASSAASSAGRAAAVYPFVDRQPGSGRSRAARVGHAESRSGWPWPLAARLLAVGLLSATGAIHLDLYLTGYRSVATIGPLFLFQVVSALVLAAALAVVSSVLLSAAGALFLLATLGGYVLSIVVGLFGFHEVRTTAGTVAGVVEVLGAAALVGHCTLLSRRGTLAAAGGARSGPAAWRRALVVARRLSRSPGAPGLSAGAAAVAGGLALGLALATASPASAGGPAEVVAIELHGYGRVLATASRRSLYLLSSEARGRITCTGGCLSLWPPLLVPRGARPRAGPGVAGRLGVIRLRGGSRQLTFNGYPLYTFVGDSGPAGAAGEGIAANGGVWYLVRAGATSALETAVRHA